MTAPVTRRRGGRVNVPVIPASLARRGNWFMRNAGVAFMRATGWRFSGEAFPDLRRFVLIVGPHTSNWDFLAGLQAMYALGIQGTFLAKHTLFKGPLGVLMRWLGGVPVDRTSSTDVVTQTAELITRSDRIIAVLTPEGTRKPTATWRTGFYWIAHQAGVPIVPVVFDYSVKEIRVHAPFVTTGDLARDLPLLMAHYRPEMALYPAKYTAVPGPAVARARRDA
jgi:1-acyl-sn-glycerol-3-phosphate acyltransferase